MARGSTIFYRRHSPSLLSGLVRLVGRVLVAGLLVLALWLPGLVWYSATMPDRIADPTTRTQAIVVLTGGSERLRTGLDLLEADMGRVLFVSGVYADTTLDALLAEAGSVSAEARDSIDLGRVATDTVGNAIETAVWMREQGFTSLRLVTGGYHMPRARLEFGAALPDATIIPHPVFPPNVKQTAWWEFPGTAALFATEYTKYLIARLRLMLPDAPARLVAPGPAKDAAKPGRNGVE